MKLAPSPDPKFNSMADLFGSDFINSMQSLGVEAEVFSSWELYHQGKFDEVIRMALDNGEKIQDIYQKVSGSRKKEQGWLPFQVICEQCGKLGTTRVFAWDGKKFPINASRIWLNGLRVAAMKGKFLRLAEPVSFPGKLTGRRIGKSSELPLKEREKTMLPKAALMILRWHFVKKCLTIKSRLDLPYEFILIGGKKMSSSKGMGLKAHDLVKILPPSSGQISCLPETVLNRKAILIRREQMPFRFCLTIIKKRPMRISIKAMKIWLGAFELSQVGEIQKPPVIRFSVLAQWVQMPNMEEEIVKNGLEEWAKYARVWVERFAPEKDKFTVQKTVPVVARNLTGEQKAFLKKVAEELDKQWDGEEFQTRIYDLGKEMGLNGKEAFAAIYLSLIGKDHGPKAAWLILSLDKEFVRNRFDEAAK